ncbi:MAG: hypothetical protein IPK82_16480 [Polyangiaceae bacterium]|nr:hypothetical protein [Polyangiaceae bacterium]
MLTTPFLTKLDSRAQVKGSRDPLGAQPLWTRLGRHVIANLTTVTDSVTDFTVRLLGQCFAERVEEKAGNHSALTTFLKWEQLVGYARTCVLGDGGFRGTERVRKRLENGTKIRLGTDPDAQILADQKVYGLWGLYTVPCAASNLLEGNPTRLTPAAREVVERSLLPALNSFTAHAVGLITDRLSAAEPVIDVRDGSKDQGILRAVAHVLKKLRNPEIALYTEHLLHGGPDDRDPTRGTQGRQRLFAELLGSTLKYAEWTPSLMSIRDIGKRAVNRGEVGQSLAFRLERICTAEALLAPSGALFDYILACDGQAPSKIADDVRRHWGAGLSGTISPEATERMEPELRIWSDDAAGGQRWVQLAQALCHGHYEDAVHLLLAQNAAVMKTRGSGAPWASVQDGKLISRVLDAGRTRLPSGTEIPSIWRHAYFIQSLRAVAAALRGDQ